MLRTGSMGAGALVETFNVSRPTLSAHFTVLVDADQLRWKRVGVRSRTD